MINRLFHDLVLHQQLLNPWRIRVMALADPLAVIIVSAHASEVLKLWSQMAISILNAFDRDHCILSLDLYGLWALKVIEVTFGSQLLFRTLLLWLTWKKSSVSRRVALIKIKTGIVSLVRHRDGSIYFEVHVVVGRRKARWGWNGHVLIGYRVFLEAIGIHVAGFPDVGAIVDLNL